MSYRQGSRLVINSITALLLFFPFFIYPSGNPERDSQNKELIKKIISSPEFYQYLQERDDIVRSHARSGIRDFFERLQSLLRRWQPKLPADSEQPPTMGDSDSFSTPIISLGFLQGILEWLLGLSDTTLSVLLLLPIGLLLIVLFYLSLRRFWGRLRPHRPAETSTEITAEELRVAFERWLASALYQRAEPKLLPASLTHRQAGLRLKQLGRYTVSKGKILDMVESYRFAPARKDYVNPAELLELLKTEETFSQ